MTRAVAAGLALLGAPLAAQAAAPPWVMGVASHAPGSYFLDVPVRVGCPQGDLIQVVAVEVGATGADITAVDSGHVNIYQDGGGSWKSGLSAGRFLATTSPREATNAGLNAGAVITLTYAWNNIWQAAIAECVPGIETKSGSADNTAGSSPTSGDGARVTLTPSSNLLTPNEPLFVATILTGDVADGWTESPGYATLYTLHNGNTLNLAYQIIAGKSPTPYAATNSASRVWSASNRSYKTTAHPR